ncbi:MAG: DUF6527 family protein [Chloroflexi bacterium]|nr:DUF6527 family protein [Chloroflexota bacterium]
MILRPEFVKYIPKQLDDSVLYVSMHFGTVVHRCACGCGEEVVTPLGPAEWSLAYDGRSISLAPSVGNWNFRCRSHYWIEEGRVRWAHGFSEDEIALVRQEARERRMGYYQTKRSGRTWGFPRTDDERGLKWSFWKIFRALGRIWRRGKE